MEFPLRFLRFLSSLVFISPVIESFPRLETFKIVGGNEAQRVPYQVSVQWKSYHICGGVVITQWDILTAAHCMFEENHGQFRIRAGSSTRQKGGLKRRVVDFKIHSNFSVDNDPGEFDIAILRLKKSLKFNKRIQFLRLPDFNEKPIAGTKGIISGWGQTSESNEDLPSQLMCAKVTILDENTCNEYMKMEAITLFCAIGSKKLVDACTADSGGPLVILDTLVGIIVSGEGCARDNEAGYYINVSYFKQWINETIEDFNSKNIT